MVALRNHFIILGYLKIHRKWKLMIHRNRTAFTLIELLMVIVIIGVLAALIVPAVSKAQDRAYTIQCASNERQMGLALTLYAGDNQDSYPWFTFATQYRQ